MAMARDVYDERLGLAGNPLVVLIGAIGIQSLWNFFAWAIAEEKRHIAETHPRVQAPDGEVFSYRPHVHGREYFADDVQIAECVAADRVLKGKNKPGLFKRLDSNTTFTVSEDPIVAATECFNTRVEASTLPAASKTKLKEAFNATLNGHLEDITLPANRKKLANYIKGLTIRVVQGKPQSYSRIHTSGDGFACYMGPGFFSGSEVTFFAGHKYSDTHIKQVANNLLRVLVGYLPPEPDLAAVTAVANRTDNRTRPGAAAMNRTSHQTRSDDAIRRRLGRR